MGDPPKKSCLSVDIPILLSPQHSSQSPTTQSVALPNLLAPNQDLLKEWDIRSNQETAQLVEENFNVTEFIQSHGFIDNHSALTQAELTAARKLLFRHQNGSLFLFSPRRMLLLLFAWLYALFEWLLNGEDPDVDTFYNHLRTANFNEDHTVLDLGYGVDADVASFLCKDFQNELFVRKCYWQLFYLIELMVLLKWRRFIITGTNGIGKTRFGLFYMSLAAKQGKVFLYHYSPDEVYLFGPGIARGSSLDEMATWLRRNKTDNIDYYFFDTERVSEPDEDLFSQCKVAVAFSSSPSAKRFKHFLSRFCATQLVMKMPDVQELMVMREFIPAFKNTKEEVFQQQLAWYGPVPRYVLGCLSKEGDLPLRNAFSAKSVRFLRKVLASNAYEISSGDDEEISYPIIHMDSSNFSMGEVSYSFASEYVMEKVASRNNCKKTLSFCGITDIY